jgi:hypothetical protein
MWPKIIFSSLTVVFSHRQSGEEFHLLQQKFAEKSSSDVLSPPADAESCPVPLRCHCLDQTDVSHKYYVDWRMCDAEVEIGEGGMPIRYRNVAPLMDLVITNLTKYTSPAPEKNGRNGCLGQLNIAAPGSLKVKFSLVEAGTNIPVHVGSTPTTYEMTVFDLDESKAGMREKVGVSNYSSIAAVVLKPTMAGGTAWFEASKQAVPNPSADNLFDLTSKQIDASFSVSYKGTSEWVVDFEAEQTEGGASGGRNFFFSGTSCASASRHECECPPPTPAPTPPCPVPLECDCMDNNGVSTYNYYADWNLCDAEVEKTGPGGLPIRYKRVTPVMDLVITNLTKFESNDPAKNGKSGCLGQLNLVAPGDVDIKFSLVKSGTDTPELLASTKELTVFDFDSSLRGIKEMVGVSDYSSITSNVLNYTMEGTTAWFTATQVEVPNPDTHDLNNLTSAQIGASFSVSYIDTSEWIVKFKAKNTGKKGQKGGRNFLFSGTSCASANRHNCRCPGPTEPPIVQR